MPRTIAIFTALAITTFATSASADQVLLRDGSLVVGKVKQLVDRKLTVTTTFAGDVQIDITHVTGITTDKPVTSQADSGDRAVGQLNYIPEIGQTVVTDPAGRLNIAIDRITAIWAAGEPSPEEKKQAKQLYKLEHPWSGKFGIGISGQSGNSETIAANSDAVALRNTGDERLKLHVHSRYTRENGEESTNEVFGGVGLEKDINERWFTFANLDMEFDRQEDLDLRSKVTLGGGYFAIREDDEELKLRAGAGYQHESFKTGLSEDQAVAEIGVDYKTQITPALLLTHSSTYFPSFDRLNDYRLVTETAGEIPLTAEGMALRLGLRHTYDARPVEGTDRLDTFYFLNVVWSWKE